VDETSLIWKTISSSIYTFQEQMHPPQLTASKNCFMLMLGSKALADLKLKPLIIYYPGTP
jgi:hypothetical protein